MNETSLMLDEGHAASSSTEKASNAAEHDVHVAADTAPRLYKALPRRSGQPNFMDFFAARRRPPVDQNAPRYRALAEPPTDLPESESPVAQKILEASPEQSSEETAPHRKAASKKPLAA